MPFRRMLRYFRNVLDLFVAWLLWGPTRFSRAFSRISGIRIGILPRFATKAFHSALRMKFFRSSAEILRLAHISVSPSRLNYLTDQCLLNGFFGRAALNAENLTQEKRAYLTDRLVTCDQLELAEAVAQIDGKTVPEQTAALIALRRLKRDARAELFASRIGPPAPHFTEKHRKADDIQLYI